ncbi:MAG: IS66 family transposase [Pseudobdellovibrionaceae bacterium]|nr:IS66 family transposase [Bdellovibrionales bacterium]USN46782.1 MAG: IS66 family transposase [Pseudobdellovibrionaceae bacterium]
MQTTKASLIEENKSLNARVLSLSEENEKLRAFVLQMKREIFGPKSERFENLSPDQLALVFDEIEASAKLPSPPETEKISYLRKKKGKGKRRPIPEDVQRREEIIDIPEEQKICPHDGTALECIGAVVTEKLETIPAQSTVIIERRLKYACPCCESHMTEAKSSSILPGTIATPELLSFLIFSKFFQGLPLYRLEEFYRLSGIELTRSTMARWLVQVASKLMPLWNILEEMVFDSGYVAMDATVVQVLKEEGRKPQTKSSMWVRGSPEKGIVLFDYDVSGGGAAAKRLVTGYTGALQADAHRGYGALEKHHLTLLGCLMHARRRFHKAWLEAKREPGLAAEGLAMIRFLYDKEESYRDRNLTPEERKHWRDLEIAPSMEAIKKWCEDKKPQVLPSSALGNAISYYMNEYEELTAFLKDGRYEIDNGWVERQIKRFAIGRKNWLFCDTVEGANASSVLYSLALTAKLNGKSPFEVMVQIFKELPTAESADDYERLVYLLLSPENPQSCRKKEGAVIH